jgi:hypothetical protein
MKLTINSKKSIQALTTGFDYKYINSNFILPTRKIDKFEYRLLKLDKALRTDEVENWVNQQNCQIASIREVLEFGNQYPDEQKNGWIFTVEQIAGQFFFAVLYVNGDKRNVGVHDFRPDGGFGGSDRVLVRELEPGLLGTSLETLPLELIINGKKYKRED